MAFAATLVLSVNAVNKTLNRINQDNYGSEYLLRETLQEFRVKIRHTKQKPASAGGRNLDRHNYEVTQTVFATATAPATVRTMYFVYVIPVDDSLVEAGYLAAAMGYVATNAPIQTDLLNWMS